MAVSFNGTSDVISMGNNAPLNIATNAPMAMACWVNFATLAPGAQEVILGRGFDGTVTSYFFTLAISPFTIQWGTFNGTAVHGFSSTVATLGLVTNTWYHFYGDYTGSGTHLWRFYINGVDVSSGGTSDTVGPINNAAKFAAAAVDNVGAFVQFFSGCLADPAVFNGPLTGTEITNLGNGSLRPNAGMSQTLLGYWKFDTNLGTQPDQTANGNNGTATGTSLCGSGPLYAQPFLPPTFTQSPILQVRNRVLAY